MQVNPSLPPPSRPHDPSPTSSNGSEWSGVNNYNTAVRAEGPYGGMSVRGGTMSPAESHGSNDLRVPQRAKTFGTVVSSNDPPPPRGPSENGSRSSSRATSLANSRSSDGTISDRQSRKYLKMEAELKQHYAILRAYLRGGAPQPPRPNKAKDKLQRLSPVQFHELSTDVFDELQRRQAAAPLPGRPPRHEKVPPFLQARTDFHEKRNQARQKLSSLATPRFRDLSTDVFCELERRFPHFAGEGRQRGSASSQQGPPGHPSNGNQAGYPAPNVFGPPPRAHTTNGSISVNANGFPRRQGPLASQSENGATAPPSDYGRPVAKHFQSNTITPIKSTMIEDDEDDEGNGAQSTHRSSDVYGRDSTFTHSRSDHGTSATSVTLGSRDLRPGPRPDDLQEKVVELESKLQVREEEIRELSNTARLKSELEKKLQDAEHLHRSLKEELDRIQIDHSGTERDLRDQLEAARRGADGGEWRTKHAELEHEHHALQKRYDEQRQTTDEVRNQGQIFLNEMRAMAEGNSGNLEQEQKLHTEVQRLQEEVREWKARYAKAKTQVRGMRASSLGLAIARPEAGRYAHDDLYRQPDGLIKDVHMTKFQIAIDEIIRAAHFGEPSAVIEHMKAVVIAVRDITDDTGVSDLAGKDDDASKRKIKLKNKVSATANNVISAAKNYAAMDGLWPVSLLDAAAAHLTTAIVALVRVVKIRPTSPAELEEVDDRFPQSVDQTEYFPVSHRLRRDSAADSIYSALSDPPVTDNIRSRSELYPHNRPRSKGDPFQPDGLGPLVPHGPRQDDAELEELKIYIGNQTDLLVQSVQSLVGSIRSEDKMPLVRTQISSIMDAIDNVLGAAEGSLEDMPSYRDVLRQRVMPIVGVLKGGRNRLEQAREDSYAHDDKPTARDFCQNLPPLAFQIARETKELVSRVESVVPGPRQVDEDFS